MKKEQEVVPNLGVNYLNWYIYCRYMEAMDKSEQHISYEELSDLEEVVYWDNLVHFPEPHLGLDNYLPPKTNDLY